MENENHMENDRESTYHFGPNESPYSREDIRGERSQAADVNQNPYSKGNAYGQGIYTGEVYSGETAQEIPKKSKRNKKAKQPGKGTGKKVARFIATAAAFGFIAGGVMVGVNYAGSRLIGTKTTPTTSVATVTTTDTGASKQGGSVEVADVAENVMPSIVAITNTSVQTVRSWFQSYEQEVTGSGSGIIIGQNDDAILIVTNNHVIDGAKELTVAFSDETAAAATVKGADTVADLAVLEVKTKDMEEDTLSKIKVAALGSSDELRVGEQAIAIGNALGYGQSVTVGYISAVNREVDTEDKTMTMLQTDAAINPGNSGGALLNAKGEVVGINTIKYVDSYVEGMGYAIPISTAIPIINDLMNKEVIAESEQGYLGIQGNDITEEYAQNFGMPKGVYVVKIVDGSPADECGLQAGDIITKFADRDVNSMETLQNILTNKKAGQTIEMVVQRNNAKGEYEEIVISVTLGAKKDMPDNAKEEAKGKKTPDQPATEENDYDDYQMTPDEFFDYFFQN